MRRTTLGGLSLLVNIPVTSMSNTSAALSSTFLVLGIPYKG